MEKKRKEPLRPWSLNLCTNVYKNGTRLKFTYWNKVEHFLLSDFDQNPTSDLKGLL